LTPNFKALDPNVKIAYAEHEWDKKSFDVGLEKLAQVFDGYVAPISAPVEADKERGLAIVFLRQKRVF